MAYIQYGWADTLVDPENTSVNSNEGYGAPECSDFVDIKQFLTDPDIIPNFTNVQIVSYFVTRQVCDTCLCGDIHVKHATKWPYHNSCKSGGFYYSPTRTMVWFIAGWDG